MPETTTKVVMHLWLGGGRLEIWCALTKKKMNRANEGADRSGNLGMRETTRVLENDISLFFNKIKQYRFRDFEIN